MAFQSPTMIPALCIALVFLGFPAVYDAQIVMSPCTTSMLTSFTPCMNFITNSSLNATSPTSDCCNVLKTVTSNGTGCLCQIATGMPFNIPVNRSLVLSLPRACNMPGVPLQCKASGASAPAPGPEASSPALSPAASPSPSASNVPVGGDSPSLAREAPETPADSPPGTTTPSGTPGATNAGNRQSLTPPPSAASTKSFSPLLVVTLIGAVALKNY